MTSGSIAPIAVLVVEDNPADRLFVDEALSDGGERSFLTRKAERLADAIATIRDEKVDVVLLDLGLPDSHGIATLEELIALFPRLPIIILTGLSDEKLAYEAVKRGAQDYMVKGKFDDQSLPRAIEYAVERSKFLTRLQESEDRFNTAFRMSPMGLSLMRLSDRQLLDVNEAWCKMTGFSREEALGSDPAELVKLTSEVRQRIREEINAKGTVSNFEAEVETRFLGTRVLLISVEQLTLGEETCVLNTFVDITERKQAELALRESQERYRLIVETAEEGIVMTDAEANISFVNAKLASMFGYAAEEMLGRPVFSLMDSENEKIARAALERRRQGVAEQLDFQFKRKDGSVLWTIAIATPVQDDQGNYVGSLGMITDIGMRKVAEENLRLSEERYRRMVETSEEGIVVTDADGKILFANPKFASMLGYTQAEVDGNSIFAFFHEDTMALAMQIREQQLIGKAQQLDFKYKRKDGTTMWTIASVSPVLGPAGEYTGSLGMITDITTRKLAEESLKASEAHNRTLYEAAERRLAQTMALRKVDTAISNSLDLHFTLDVVVSQAIQQLKVDAADVLIYNQDSKALTFFTGQGFRTNAVQKAYVPLGRGHAGKAVLERRRVSISNLDQNLSEFQEAINFGDEGFVDFHTVPLLAKGKVLGVLETFRRTPFTPDSEWLNFLETLAGQAGIAIENITLLDDLQRANDGLIVGYEAAIEGWSRALDLRDKETEGHSLRVTDLTLRLARAMGIRDAELAQVRHGALLHDIGKMGIPDNILLKPGKLTDEEWVIMKQHPEMARRMLAPIAYLKDAMDIPYAHHEKWDGSGYPQGLSGANIPLMARIFAVADVFDALTNDRPYRKGWPKQKVLDYIREESGKHFDPGVVKAFLDLESA